MKKITVLAGLALLFVSVGLFAQDLRNNPDYRRGMELQALARQAYSEGDYEQSTEYSISAQEHFQKAREFADLMALRYTALNLRNRVQERFRYAESIFVPRDYPQEYAAAQTAFQQANNAFEAEDYPVSITGYRALLDMSRDLAPGVTEPSAELAKAESLREAIALHGLAHYRPDYASRGDEAYTRGRSLMGTDNSAARDALNDAIRYYQTVIDDAIAVLAASRRLELAEAKQDADAVNAGVLAPDSYQTAQQKQRSAEANLLAGNWDDAWDDSEEALAAYRASHAAALAAGDVKPEYYTVRLIPDRRDCFWRIAEYDFVYGDPWKWSLLYNENRHLLPDPNNPRLIEPGTRLRIPSLEGEVRSGEYVPR